MELFGGRAGRLTPGRQAGRLSAMEVRGERGRECATISHPLTRPPHRHTRAHSLCPPGGFFSDRCHSNAPVCRARDPPAEHRCLFWERRAEGGKSIALPSCCCMLERLLLDGLGLRGGRTSASACVCAWARRPGAGKLPGGWCFVIAFSFFLFLFLACLLLCLLCLLRFACLLCFTCLLSAFGAGLWARGEQAREAL
ncbi:uncharacterized protein K452DRAFT_117798 [Aplosporella prunicola CBS 121167]|uniref:Uncharacterized protein n=1 Tax=Aplosporella prunicola CBS 121167 TaxID=1176127 RepID=A0A6A6B0M0_9PEZI|nr:uncharacterized protein K452DRAFT_117798 [Aplosporella prunicola CBS 121167]KAF2136764.1 hypothetical protein K452DRAFT_117798 [Aplosporella prunicola CBS 121167]